MQRTTVVTGESHLLRGTSATEPLGPVTAVTVRLADGRTLDGDEDLLKVFNLLLGEGLASRRAQIVVESERVSPQVAASLLGVSRPTVYTWMDDGVLGWIQVGSHRRVAREDVDAILAARASRERTEEILADETLEAPLSDAEYRKAMFDARRSGGSDAAAALRRAQTAAKARQAAQRAR